MMILASRVFVADPALCASLRPARAMHTVGIIAFNDGVDSQSRSDLGESWVVIDAAVRDGLTDRQSEEELRRNALKPNPRFRPESKAAIILRRSQQNASV